ncbi:carbon starvation CstA family protein [Pontiella sulfatireligans]|uniref:Carbon starvation protein A n=1 Tax=Pontiella sulfatireligans TaxID=2750658 RepID=A0A6C2URX4_9BACT|nr:carbon starvation protein A [Pontiella sulfatireligans]VGO23008.1 Carbon starvation protein A [Pontiella sulfatireligans]
MNSLIIAVAAALLYIIAYNTYGRFLARKIFKIDPNAKCPSETHHDGIDFVATDKTVLFGHHFTSIAGTGPIVGPAIAIIWGWVPALIWIIIGSIFMGAVHDFGSMVISLRHEGRTIGDIAGDIINPRVKFLFMLIIFFALWIVIAIFGVVIASVFSIFPESVIPVWLQLPIAVWLGFMVYKRGKSHITYGIIATVLMYATIVIGAYVPVDLPAIGSLSSVGGWVILLLIYAYVASTLPVTVLLQPRDYINAFQLCIAMALLLLGILITHPPMVAPAMNIDAEGAPALIPLLFITVACGAISGFHCLVSSGTSSKQCDAETSAKPISYGGMLLEGMLAVIVIIACGAGIGLGLEKDGVLFHGVEAFNQQYASWDSAKGLGAKIAAFVSGSSNMITGLGLPKSVVLTLMGVFVASFAATTLDTATRLQRYIISELAQSCKAPAIGKKHPATFIAVFTALLLAFSSGGGKGALALWPLFGAVNQLLGGLALLVITVWLARKKIPIAFTAIPMVFMIAMTCWAMTINLSSFFADGKWLLFTIGAVITVLQTWMIVEGVIVLARLRREK